jgi:hypothetical protein
MPFQCSTIGSLETDTVSFREADHKRCGAGLANELKPFNYQTVKKEKVLLVSRLIDLTAETRSMILTLPGFISKLRP